MPEVEASCAPVTATSGNDGTDVADPPPALVVGFFGFATLMVCPAVPALRSALGTVTVNEVPAAFAFPVSGALVPTVT